MSYRHDIAPHRRPLALAAALLTLLALALAACDTSATPKSTDLLKKAQDKWATTNTLHFNMTVDKAGAGTLDNPYPTAAQGDVKRPDAMNATAGVNIGLASLNVNLIIIGSDEWLSAPGLTPSGGFVPPTALGLPAGEYASFLKIFDPHVGLGALLTQLQNPSKPSDGSANGTACYKISGTLDPNALKPIFADVAATAPVPTTFCIGKSDNRLYSAALSGKLVAGDTAGTVHTFFLSKFDAPVVVTPPPGA